MTARSKNWSDAWAPVERDVDLSRFISPASFWAPEQLGPQPAWLEHVPFAFWLVGALRPRTLVELGTHGGCSYFAFCRAVQRLEIGTQCHAIDTWKGDDHAGLYDEDVYRRVRSHHDARYAAFSTLVRATFDEALPHFGDGTIDLLHIDGRHDYRDVRHDFESWRPKLSDRGVVLMHDTNARERDFGVSKLWEELRTEHPSFEFLHGYGLGVLAVGRALANPVRMLCSASGSREVAAQVRDAYARLGSLFAVQFAAERQTAELDRRSVAISVAQDRWLKTQSELHAKSAEAARLEQDLKAGLGDVGRLREELLATAGEAARLEQDVTGARQRTAELEQALGANTATIDRINRELAAARNRSAELQQALAARSAILAHVDVELASARSRSVELQRLLEARATALTKLDGEFAVLRDQSFDLERALATQAAELASARARVAELEQHAAQIAALEATLANRTRELNSIKTSISWRVTAGLRGVAATFPRLARLVRRFGKVLWWTVTFPLVSRIRGRRRRRLEQQAIVASGMVDCDWYCGTYPDVAAGGSDPVVHYLDHGAKEGRDPNPLFNTAWYLERNLDVRASGVNPLLHYLRYGAAEGREPNPLFDSDWYASRYPDVRASGMNPLAHYMRRGMIEQRDPNPLFDSDWYLSRNSDVRASGMNAFVHFVRSGMFEGRDPSALFDSEWYLSRYPDVRASGMMPFVHYLHHGRLEGRQPCPFVDEGSRSSARLQTTSMLPSPPLPSPHQDAEPAPARRAPGPLRRLASRLGGRLGARWRRHRLIALIASSPLFDAAWYRRRNPDVPGSDRDLAAHYLAFGGIEGRDPSALFDSDWYLEQNPDVRAKGVNPLVHYLLHGVSEGRDPRRLPGTAHAEAVQRIELWEAVEPPADGQRIRTIAVSHNLNHEGAPNSQLELIVGLYRRGVIEPVVLSPHDGPLRSSYENARVPTHLVSPPDTSTQVAFERTVRAMASAFRESGAQLVYANTLQAFWAIAAAERAGLPAIWNVRESEPWNTYFDYLAPEIRPVAYRAFGYPHRIVFVADATRRSWEPVKRCDNFATIYNSLDADRLQRRAGSRDRSSVRAQLRIDPAEVVIALVGTVCERKGQLDLVRALKLLPEEVASRVRVFIVGDRAGAYSLQLHREVAALPPDRASRVIIVRETGEPYLYFQAADIALCCSRIESYPRVTLEAMAFRLPIVTTPVFGIVEQVQEGVNALFYTPGDVGQLASQLARLITDGTLRGRMASESGRILNDLPSRNDMLDAYGRVFAEAARMRDQSFAARAAAE